jgi:hypothetical protein
MVEEKIPDFFPVIEAGVVHDGVKFAGDELSACAGGVVSHEVCLFP